MSDCINHIGATVDGYGAKKHNGRLVRAHRLAFCEAHGLYLWQITGKVVMHSCDNRLCINPDHLSLGSHADNCADKVRKNRQARGEKHGNSKFSDGQVKWIKTLLSEGESNAKIARAYGVSAMCISRIRTGKTWGHI